MPFKSKAQRRNFAELLVEGKIMDEQYEGVEPLDRQEGAPGTHPSEAVGEEADIAQADRQETNR